MKGFVDEQLPILRHFFYMAKQNFGEGWDIYETGGTTEMTDAQYIEPAMCM